MNLVEGNMAKQKTPHTQTEQNTKPEQTDLEPEEQQSETGLDADDRIYESMDGAATGSNRAPRSLESGSTHRRAEAEEVAHEGTLSMRAPKHPAQGITSRSAAEESSRQEKVVNARPDAQAGVNHLKQKG